MKKLIAALLVCALATNGYALDRPDASQYPLNDENVTVLNILPYAQTNQNLHDLHGLPYTRQFWFTLESSTNLADWHPVCTVTGWCNNYHILTAAYADGVLVSSCYKDRQQGQPLIDKCIAAVIGVGLLIYVTVKIVKACNNIPVRNFDEPSEPPATNSVSITLPPEVANVNTYFIRVAAP